MAARDLPRIERIDVHCLRVPLVRPYRLAFGDLTAFDTLLVELTDDGGARGFGEATLLSGYGDESMSDAWPLAQQLAETLAGADDTGYCARLGEVARRAPFTTTAFFTALEMLRAIPALTNALPLRAPLLALLNADDETGTRQEFESLLEQGYRTVKVKVGLPGVDDAARIRRIQRVVDGRARIRIDANQAFTGAEAAQLLSSLDPQDIELFEQPCAADDWAAHAQAAQATRVPLMLDESIYNFADIDRAAQGGLAAFVKVKLVKFFSVERLEEAVARIRHAGMQPVLGNGVACDIGCWMEACVAARSVDNAGEMNGLLKPRGPLLANPPRVERGELLIEAGYRPELDREAVRRYTAASYMAAAEHR